MNLRPHAKLHPLPLAAVRWTVGFWADRFQTCKDSTVPTMGRIMQESERPRFVGNFEVAAGLTEGKHRGAKWDDGDFYKWLESAAATLAQSRATTSTPATGTPGEGRGGGSADKASTLDAQLDRLIALIARAQDPDGYIHTDIQIRQHAGEDAKRFGNPMDFEMYNMGHLMTAACIHHEATGKTNLLTIAQKAADFLAVQFKSPTPEVARHGICPSHLMGLVDLYRATQNKKYLDLAVKLLAMRDLVEKGDDDNQDRLPLKQHRDIVGHAVRATYLYAGVADIFAETGDESLLPVLHSTWNDLVSHKLYITGGCGALFDGASPDGSEKQETITRVHQAFGRNYQLPQSTAHNETCAAIGFVLWNWRMLQLTAEAKFADLLEQTLYNSVLTGISLDGTSYFYTNTLRQLNPMPVDLRWDRRRQKTIACFCCPPNVARTVAESNNFAYLQSDKDVYAILYGSSTLETKLDNHPLKLRQETNYPWDGLIRLTIEAAPATDFTLHLRIPAWAKEATLTLNNKPMSETIHPGTFHALNRKWSPNDTVELNLPMPVRFIESHPQIEETRNHLAILRGPIVYCLESTDLPKGTSILEIGLSPDATFTPTTDASLPGLTVLKGHATTVATDGWSTELYRDLKPHPTKKIDIQLIPYFAWDNRGESEMTVWLPQHPGEGK
jgi:uncharacterized protein